MRGLPLLLSLGSTMTALATSANAVGSSCQSLNISLEVTTSNVNITIPEPKSTSDLIDFTERIIALNGHTNITEMSTSGTVNVSGTYSINAQLCVPPPGSQPATRNSTVQFLIHGIGFDKSYWDFPFDPANYSYVQAANKAGFTTFAIDRLGVGLSSKPDPILAVQLASHVEIVKQLTEKLRQGTTGFKGIAAFEKVILVGHSFGSAISNTLVAEVPSIADGLVLTGYAHNATGLGPFFAANMFDRAKAVDPSRFASLPGGYLLPSGGIYGNELAFFHVGGFNQEVANLATKTTQTATIGELVTIAMGVLPAPGFKGPVLTITGQEDQPFCAGSCFGDGYPYIVGQDSQFWPASSNFTAHSPLNTGHGLNLHFSAPDSYAFIFDFLESNGF
ncbi:alpha/beta-hydrolase [Schizopora paradoxa]|uniref:Alpha/beta-hydrolase n=1 Tax=Schizopora paradoxa TaxID=27342 RepID=A0A0H2RT27_9AGAM|nr:alpha/beta-hydrolase [Schizopora paradoxa]